MNINLPVKRGLALTTHLGTDLFVCQSIRGLPVFERKVGSDVLPDLKLLMEPICGLSHMGYQGLSFGSNTWLELESFDGIIACHPASQQLIWKCLCSGNTSAASIRNVAKGSLSAIFGDIWWYLRCWWRQHMDIWVLLLGGGADVFSSMDWVSA